MTNNSFELKYENHSLLIHEIPNRATDICIFNNAKFTFVVDGKEQSIKINKDLYFPSNKSTVGIRGSNHLKKVLKSKFLILTKKKI